MQDRFDRFLVAKWAVRAFVERRGFQLIKGATLHQFLADRTVDLVIDVGANEGQYSRSLRRWGYAGDIVAVEPVGATFTRLAARFARDMKFTAVRTALGASGWRGGHSCRRQFRVQLDQGDDRPRRTVRSPRGHGPDREGACRPA